MWSGNQADGCDGTALVRCEFECGFGLRSFDGDVTTEDGRAPDAMRITAIRAEETLLEADAAEETEGDFYLHEADYASADELATSISVADSDDWDDDDDDDDLHDDNDDDDDEDDYLDDDDDDDLDADDDMDV